ncbi:M56 family metallopeptidase [Qipengyuania marisflavi]|uniref:Peptidase M56 domain-containing protein n=1 Tax=Qipengyuania marisflavi TaxID=2486356 RepID=A0A5S3Q141_9SPHN|nr:M56 family metallopeptidase [Qipengyuania marisflavi]TMM50067.1 hypothetical protein FEV51_02400 [Qipengyuania marisflavi]
MSPHLSQFLIDTLLWTGALVALVLVLRRPVARYCGARAAYALWLLPVLRLVMPPLVLPRWLQPIGEAQAPVQGLAGEAMTVAASGAEIAGRVGAVPEALPSPVDLTTPLLTLWLGGVAIFLARRFALYHQLRRELLDEARPVGESGRVRLIETPAISGPIAFGVHDKVIALPMGFMVSRDKLSRDLALEHELAHHRGQDLLVNILVQPLFALHWFNPLGWAGWRALRRDQEAACDARVVAARSQTERAAYAGIIADFARRPGAAPRFALAAPMACPVLGDKSIIHRLRSLSMSDISPRRRLATRLAFGTALVALPLTASISYAEIPAPEVPIAPAPLVSLTSPVPPIAPLVPPAPEAPAAPDVQSVEIDTMAWTSESDELEEELSELDEELREVDRELAAAEHEIIHVQRKIDKKGHKHVTRHIHRRSHDGMTAEQRAELRTEMKELRKQFGENGEVRRQMRIAIREAKANAPEVVVSCRSPDKPVTSETTADGKTRLYVCESAAANISRDAISKARAAIAAEHNIPAEARAEALSALDEELAQLPR